MSQKHFLLSLLFVLSQLAWAQVTKEQLVGRVIDIANNKGLEGVAVQLLSLGTIKYTDADGKFKFENPKGFVVGEPNYSFTIQKEGYITVESTNNKVVYGSGSIENLSMKKDLERYLWITVLDGKTGNVLEQASVNSKGVVHSTNTFGKVRFDFSAYKASRVKIIVRKNCYKDEIVEVPTKGEIFVKMIPDCTSKADNQPSRRIDMTTAPQLLDRALQARNGSKQGQVKAIEFLLKSDFNFSGTDFSGVNLKGIQFKNTDLSGAKFDFSNLEKSNLNGAILKNNTLHFARADSLQLLDGILSKGKAAYLKATNARFNGTDLSGSFFFGCDFSGTDFTGANLEGTVFAFCTLTNTIFEKTILRNTQLNGCILNGATFKGAQIENMGIRGTSITEGPFPFSEQQMGGICRKLGYGGQPFRRAEYHFTLIEVSENIPTGQGRYDVAYEKRYGFANFGGTTFEDCPIITEDKYSPFESMKVYKSDVFLNGNNRFSFVRRTVDDHYEFLKSYLHPEYTIKNSKVIAAWEELIRRDLKKKKFPSVAVLTPETVLAIITKNKLELSSPIDWEHYAEYHLGEKVNENDEELFQNTGQYLFPFDIRWPDLPAGWEVLYRKWILTKASSHVQDIIIPMNSYRFVASENDTWETQLRSYRRQEGLQALKTKNIGLARTLGPNISMGTGESRIDVLIVYPKTVGKLRFSGVGPSSKGNSTKLDLVLQQKAKITKVEILKTDTSDHVLIHIAPTGFFYRTGTEKWKKVPGFTFVE